MCDANAKVARISEGDAPITFALLFSKLDEIDRYADQIAEKVFTLATVTRSNTDTEEPLTVSLASTDTSEAIVPASTTLVANSVTANFHVTAIDDSLEDGSQLAQISASAAGYVSVPADLTVVSHPFPWQNFVNNKDVDGNGNVVLMDALRVINEINLKGARLLPDPTVEFGPPPFFDVNGDHYITAGDVLVIFNYLNQQASGEGEAGPWLAASLPELPAVPNKKVADLSHQAIFSEEKRSNVRHIHELP